MGIVERLREDAEYHHNASHDCDCNPTSTINYQHAVNAIEAAQTIEDLSKEVVRLRKDKARLDWLADVDNNIGGVYLPNDCVMQNIADMREAIDAAMDMHKNKPKIDTSPERVEKSAESIHVDEFIADICQDDPQLTILIEEAKKTITADDVATCFVRVDCDGSHHSEHPLDMVDWPEDESRIDIIGSNGGDGAHYGR